jgi:hypothetical protein
MKIRCNEVLGVGYMRRRNAAVFVAMIVILASFPCVIFSTRLTKPEPIFLAAPEGAMETIPEQDIIDDWMMKNATIAIEMMNEFLSGCEELPTRAISYWIDIKVVYDANAFAWATSRSQIPSVFFTSMAWTALHLGFGQFWSDMDFYVGLDPNWCVLDVIGCQQPWGDLGELLSMWSTNSYGWPAPSSWTTRGTALAPAGSGHGSYFDLLVMFVVEPLRAGVLGVTWRGHNALLINLAAVFWWSTFSDYGLPGLLSVIMHETGHDYRVQGDTSFEHMDVMDYFWGFFHPFSHLFDEYHRSVIGVVRYMHSV